MACREVPTSAEVQQLMFKLHQKLKIREAFLEGDIKEQKHVEKSEDIQAEKKQAQELNQTLQKIMDNYVKYQELEVTLRGNHQARDSGIGSMRISRPSESVEDPTEDFPTQYGVPPSDGNLNSESLSESSSV